MSKRKRDQSAASNHAQPVCILHVPTLSGHGSFTPFSKVKGSAGGKLQELHKIRDRRLLQPHESPYRMSAVCTHIPATLPNDLESVGYHGQCYQRFPGNLHRLGDAMPSEQEPSTSHRHHSHHKSVGSTAPIFPPECIFCGKSNAIKGDHRRTERPETFPSWKKGKCMGAD